MSTSPLRLVFAGLLLAVLSGITALSREPSIRADVDLVLVPVTVLDSRSAAVTNLSKEQFQIFEDKAPQEIVSFAREDAPASVGLVFDISGSMRTRMPEALSSAHALFRKINPDDELFLVTFANRPEAQSGFTDDFETVAGRLRSARPGGCTALMDAVYLALQQIRAAQRSRKALVIVSDGMDNCSRYTRSELMNRAREADAQIYAITIHEPPRTKKAIQLQEERRAIFLMDDLASFTGGISVLIRSIDGVGRAVERISVALHEQYVLGYRPPEKNDAHKWRRIQIRVKAPNVRLYARSGYYAR